MSKVFFPVMFLIKSGRFVESLTHAGRQLTSIEKYDRVEDSDDDDGATMDDINFGGGNKSGPIDRFD